MNSVFHAGETALQSAAGSRERLAEVGPRVIREEMPEQHRAFFASLPFVVVATTDPSGQPHLSVLAGAPGFVSAPDGRHLQIAGRPAPDDPLDALLTPGARFGLLGIEAHTRRRNRANGRVLARSTDGLSLGVEQSFGNCPKYIHPRLPRPLAQPPGLPRSLGADLDDKARALIAGADTLFIASAAAPGGDADLSHRGGTPGFVSVARTPAGVVLTLADQPGNRMFSTLGNLLLHPLAGLLFVDLAHGHLLQVATRAAVDMRSRTLQLQVLQACWRPHALGLAWVDAAGAAPPA